MSLNPEEQDAVARPAVYHRWRDERSPLIVELKLDLVPRILEDLKAAEDLGLEGGGVLIGSFPKSIGAPALRIEDFETVLRRAGDGEAYVLLAEQRQRFTAVRKRVATRDVSAVGFFRSQLKGGAFELTLADRDLLSVEFKNTIHVALLIGKETLSASGAGGRRLATFFVSVNGIIQNRVDPQTLPFDMDELEKQTRNQSKLQVGVPPMPIPLNTKAAAGGNPTLPAGTETVPPLTVGSVRRAAWLGVSAIALLAVLFGLWGWQLQGSRLTAGLLPASTKELTVTVLKEAGLPGHRQALEIDWDRKSEPVLDAARAHLTITNTNTHQTIRELDLQPHELAVGHIRAEMDDQPVEVLLTVVLPDGKLVAAVGQPAR